MSRFGQKREDQLSYENAKLRKANEEIIQQSNEIVEMNKQLKLTDDARMRVMFLMLYELGGEFTVSPEEMNSCEGKIIAQVDEKTGATKFILQGPSENEEIPETK